MDWQWLLDPEFCTVNSNEITLIRATQFLIIPFEQNYLLAKYDFIINIKT